MYKTILKIVAVLILGALGALFFDVFALPYLLSNSYFERFQFVKDFKQGKIIINPKEQVYIQENTALESAVLKVEKSVVAIQSQTESGYFTASALIATSDGSVITLANLAPSASNSSLFINGEKTSFKVLKRDSKNNLVLLKIDKSNLETVGFADFNNIKLGQRVFLVSVDSTKAGSFSVNEGIIKTFDQNSIKTNMPEKYIASGSPLFNIYGELVGLNYIDQDGKVSAIPISKIKDFLGI
ncbi:MAG: serine protease [Patescibacteria group bacterium]